MSNLDVEKSVRVALHNAQDENLTVAQVGSLRALLFGAIQHDPQLMDTEYLVPVYVLLYGLIGRVIHEHGGKTGRPRDVAGWELKLFGLGAMDALAKIKDGRGAKAEAGRHVIACIRQAGLLVADSYLQTASKEVHFFPNDGPVNIIITRKGIKNMLLRQHDTGSAIEEVIRSGIEQRVRTIEMLESQ